MIYLIGGAPRVGKSTLASLILERKGISCISTDVFRNALDHSPAQTGFLRLDASDLRAAFGPYLYQFLRSLNKKYPNYVVEGDIFTPTQVLEWREKLDIRCCFLGASAITVEDIVGKDTGPNWVSKLAPEEQRGVPKRIVQESEMFKRESGACGFPYFDIHPNRTSALESAYDALMNT